MKAAETLSDGLEKLEQIVKPLQWSAGAGEMGLHGMRYNGKTARGSYYIVEMMVHGQKGERWYVAGLPDDYGTADEAKAAADADNRTVALSSLNLDPVLSEIKRMREALEEIVREADDYTTTGAQCRLIAIRALSTLSPQEPDNG